MSRSSMSSAGVFASTSAQYALALVLWQQSQPWFRRATAVPPLRSLTARDAGTRRFCRAVQTTTEAALLRDPLASGRGFRSAELLPLPLDLCWTAVGLLTAPERSRILLCRLPFFRPVPLRDIPHDPVANLLWGTTQCPSLFRFSSSPR